MIAKLKAKTLPLIVIGFLIVLTALISLSNKVQAADFSITPSNGYTITSNKTFVLNQDCTLNSGTITIDGTTISNVDLNGHTLTSNTRFTFTFRPQSNSSISNGTIELTQEESNGIDIYGAESSNITVENVTIQGKALNAFGIAVWGGNVSVSSSTINLPNSTGIFAICGEFSDVYDETFGNPVLNINNGTEINAENGVVSFNGANGTSTINIGDADISGSEMAVGTDGRAQLTGDTTINIGYPDGNTNPILTGGIGGLFCGNAHAEINVYNGNISGPSGVIVLGGDLNLFGGTITGNGNPDDIAEPPENDGDFIWNGSALFIEQKPSITDDYGDAYITIGGSNVGQPVLESKYTNTIGSNATGSLDLNVLNMITISGGTFIAPEGTKNISQAVSNAYTTFGQENFKDEYIFGGTFSNPVNSSSLSRTISYGFYGITNQGTSVYGYYISQANAQAAAQLIDPNNPPTVVAINPVNPNLGPNEAEIKLNAENIYLAPVGTPNGINSGTLTATITNGNVNPNSIVWECNSSNLTLSQKNGLTNTVTATTVPGVYRITAYIEGSNSQNNQAICNVTVSSDSLVMDTEKSILEVTSPDYYTVSIVPIANPAIEGLDAVPQRVSIFTWSQVGQTDMDCKVATNNGDGSFSYTFPVNNTPINNYYLDASDIIVHVYASEDATTNGTMIFDFNWNYSDCDWEKSIIVTPYVQNQGFITPSVGNGEIAGTTGQNIQMEGIRLAPAYDLSGVNLVYDVHVRNLGWMDQVGNGVYTGTMNQNLPIEAIHIGLTGENASNYSIQYQAYIQNNGWQPWKENGQEAGTTGLSLGIEALRIQLVPSGTPLPSN